MAVKIMITDDHSMIREGLKSLLELDGDIEVDTHLEESDGNLQDSKFTKFNRILKK